MRKSLLLHYIYAYVYVALLPKWGMKHTSAPLHTLLIMVEKTPSTLSPSSYAYVNIYVNKQLIIYYNNK